MNLFNQIYKDKTILLTGHTGFKGSWLATWLVELGARVVGIGLDPAYENHAFDVLNVKDHVTDIRTNIQNPADVLAVFSQYQPDFVFHFAAQPIVRTSYKLPIETFTTNLNGTLHLLEAIRQTKSVRGGVFVTTDKIYHNQDWWWGYRENDPKGGYDPYSASKACCELAIDCYRKSYFKHTGQYIASIRTGNTMGGGDWSKDRIIPDSIRACADNAAIELRHPAARRPWQFVLEPLSAYLYLGYKLLNDGKNYAEPWNIGPTIVTLVTVKEIAEKVIHNWGSGQIKVADQVDHVLYESSYLNVDVSKTFLKLEWQSALDIDHTIRMTVDWYKKFITQPQSNMRNFSIAQIEEYLTFAREKSIPWSDESIALAHQTA